ncbi:hypothetical protein ARMGADRAFT_1092943 [Armillaria gallica]|uniref:Uncharacterized protein n=1 Tax=Armillaria gallica TaxID=47427 RepID=A0A2H3CKC4_ARMGA|nr:hypothetical protein ARMGADRAFT_1092943 [Armillaria gallica]
MCSNCAFSSNARGLGPGAPLLILYTPPTLVKHIWLRWSLQKTLQGVQGKSSGFDVSIKLRTVVIIFSNLDGLLAPSIYNKGFDIPLDLTGDGSVYIFQFLDTQLNCGMLYALLHGVYTGILAVMLWNIFINKRWPLRRALVIVIIILYILITISFAVGWSSMHSAFIENGQSFQTVYLKLNGIRAFYLETAITSSTSTGLTGLYMIWCCWVVWGWHWLIILPPIFFLLSVQVYHEYINESADIFPVLYTLFRRGAEGRLGAFHHFVEVLVESLALYSVSLILFLAFAIRDDLRMHYFDIVAGIVKGIAPMLLVGRITAGHRAHPDNSWQGSEMASTSIRSHSQEHRLMNSWEDRPTSLDLDCDLETQREISVREPSPTRCSVADYVHPNTDVSPGTSPHLWDRSLLHNCSSPYEDATCSSIIVDEAAASSR